MKYVRQKQVYVRWFFSYLLLLIPPIVIGVMIYSHTLKANQEQAERLNQSLMRIITNEFDYQVDAVLQDLSRLALDNNVQQLSNTRGSFTSKDQYQLYALYSELRGTSFSEDYIDEVFIYFKNTGWVVSTQGNMSYELYYELSGENEDYSLEEMREYLSAHHFKDVVSLENDDKQYLLFTMNCIQSSVGEPSAVIGMRIDVSNLDELFREARWDERIQLGIVDGTNQLLHITDEHFLAQADYEGLLEDNYQEKIVSDEPYLGTVMPARKLEWKYLLFVPEALYTENARQIQKVCVTGLLSCIIIGLFLSYYLCKVNYNPLKDLMEMFKKQGRVTDVAENEFRWLNQQSQRFFTEYNTNRRLLSNNQRQLKWYAS